MKEVTFLDTVCTVKIGKYMNGNRPTIELFEKETGEPFMVASTNLPEIMMLPGETAIKNYSENEGILDVLLEAGIIELTGREVSSGFVVFPIVKIKES